MPDEKSKTQGRRKRKQPQDSTPSNYRELSIGRVRGNKWNPRTTGFDGPKFDELVTSIRQKGVIQPIVVRSIQEEAHDFEILAGERRHRAMCLIASEDPMRSTIPAIIRECGDEEAFEVCFIENLQRQDLTEPEEARAFAEYVDQKGTDGIIILAERLGVSPRYVRKRVEIMRLPKPIIWAWRKDLLQYGHLEQFLRISGKKDRLMMLKQIIGAWNEGEGIPTVRDFKQAIDEASADLGRALFDKRACGACAKNSETQRNLFGIGDQHARCLDSPCYLAKQKEWLTENWQEHLKNLDPQLITNGIRFSDEVFHGSYEPFYYRAAPEKCLGCENFVTILNTSGNVHHNRVCCGSADCRREILYNRSRSSSSSMQPDRSAEGTEPARDGTGNENDTPVKAWHGEFFREKFFKVRIPEKAKELDPFDDKMVRLSLFAIVTSNSNVHSWFSQRLDLAKKPKESDYGFFLHCKDILPVIEGLESDRLPALLHETTIQVLLNNRTVMPNTRREAARFLGIDLAAEWRITKDYLEKKTKNEIVSIINRFKILDQPQAWKFACETYGLKLKSAVGRLKKDQMAGIILDSGIDLAGIVPAEILHDSAAFHTGSLCTETDGTTQSTVDGPKAQTPADLQVPSLTNGGEAHAPSNCSNDIPYGTTHTYPGYTLDPEEEEVQDAVSWVME